MQAQNQKNRNIELLKFVGILLTAIALTGFMFMGDKQVSQTRVELLQAKKDSLAFELRQYQLQEKKLAATLYYVDSTYELIRKLGVLENQMIGLKQQGLAGEATLMNLRTQITYDLTKITAVLLRLNDADQDTIRTFKKGQSAKDLNLKYVDLFSLILSEKQFKRAAILGQAETAKDEELQRLQDELAKEQLAGKFENKISLLQGQSTDCTTNLANCQTNLTTAGSLLTECKALLSTEGTAIQTHGSELRNKTTRLNTVVQEMVINNRNKDALTDLIQEYNRLADQFLQISQSMGGLNAKIK